MKAITVENLSKVYSFATAQSEGMSFREMLVQQAQSLFKKGQHQEPFYALKDVSFEVEQGEVLGIIGKNGSGKSTLLKILSKITAPTSGRAIVRGRVASLLEVGTGFHAELTGRENIFMSGIILGMKRWEINKHFDEIVAFAGIEKFLDMPVKKYSSGMRLRLAFSVAAHLQPEILLVDEVLAVGDYEFEKRCLKAMEGITNAGRTILFVSHNMDTVARLSSKVLHLQKGAIINLGRSKDVIDNYLGLFGYGNSVVKSEKNNLIDSELVYLKKLKILNQSLLQTGAIDAQEDLYLEILYSIKQGSARIFIVLYFYNDNNDLLFTTFESFSHSSLLKQKGDYKSICKVPKNIFQQGNYSITVEFANAGLEGQVLDTNLIARLHKILSFSISKRDFHTPFISSHKALFNPFSEWRVEKI